MHKANRRQRMSESSMWLMTEQRSECTRCHVHDDDLFDSSEGDRWLEVPTSRVAQFSCSVRFSKRLKDFFSKSSSSLIKVFSICLAPGYVFSNQSASHFSPSRELCAFCVHNRLVFWGKFKPVSGSKYGRSRAFFPWGVEMLTVLCKHHLLSSPARPPPTPNIARSRSVSLTWTTICILTSVSSRSCAC